MPDQAPPATPRLIKRYENRKLYDAGAGRYVTMADLAGLVGRGEDVRVLDQRSGEDVTAATLAQVILEGLRQRTARIPGQVLARLVRLGFGPVSAWGDWVGPQEAAARARDEAERIAGRLLARGRLTLEEAVTLRHEIAASVHQIVTDAQSGLESRIRSLLARGDGEALASLHALGGRLNALEAYLERPAAKTRTTGRPRGRRRKNLKHS